MEMLCIVARLGGTHHDLLLVFLDRVSLHSPEAVILLPQALEYWDDRLVPPQLDECDP